MQNLKKAGFSSIMQVTILSVLSIIAMSLVWGYVKDLSQDLNNQLSPTIDCISQNSNVEYACLNRDGKIEVSVKKGLDEDINSLIFNLDGEFHKCENSCESCTVLSNGNSNKIYLETAIQNPNNLIVSINGCLPQAVQISNC